MALSEPTAFVQNASAYVDAVEEQVTLAEFYRILQKKQIVFAWRQAYLYL
jgi:hypothetical protein